MLSECAAGWRAGAVAPWYRRAMSTDEAHSAPDQELVHAIAVRGNEARGAETELCRRFAPRIRLYGLRHLRDEEGARDLVQSVLAAVLQAARAGRIEDPQRLDRFVLGTCRNCALAARRSAGRTRPAAEELIAGLEAPAPEPLDKRALMGCFDRLDLRAKQIVMLSFQQEQSADQIACGLETTAGNVRVLRHRALSALRRCLDAHEEASR
jgi:RNA polymerase sigma-70 factor (ECF subfamily)